MRIKIDENLPAGLAQVLGAMGHEVWTVPQQGLRGKDDAAIWVTVQRERLFLITQDLHFSDARAFPPGKHQGILLVRLRVPSRQALLERVALIFETEDVQGWTGCFVVASERKIRVHRQPIV